MSAADCLVSRQANELIERDAMQQQKVIRNFYSSPSDSELISIWCMFKDRSDGVAMAEAETELVRRGGRSDEPEVRFRMRRKSVLTFRR